MNSMAILNVFFLLVIIFLSIFIIGCGDDEVSQPPAPVKKPAPMNAMEADSNAREYLMNTYYSKKTSDDFLALAKVVGSQVDMNSDSEHFGENFERPWSFTYYDVENTFWSDTLKTNVYRTYQVSIDYYGIISEKHYDLTTLTELATKLFIYRTDSPGDSTNVWKVDSGDVLTQLINGVPDSLLEGQPGYNFSEILDSLKNVTKVDTYFVEPETYYKRETLFWAPPGEYKKIGNKYMVHIVTNEKDTVIYYEPDSLFVVSKLEVPNNLIEPNDTLFMNIDQIKSDDTLYTQGTKFKYGFRPFTGEITTDEDDIHYITVYKTDDHNELVYQLPFAKGSGKSRKEYISGVFEGETETYTINEQTFYICTINYVEPKTHEVITYVDTLDEASKGRCTYGDTVMYVNLGYFITYNDDKTGDNKYSLYDMNTYDYYPPEGPEFDIRQIYTKVYSVDRKYWIDSNSEDTLWITPAPDTVYTEEPLYSPDDFSFIANMVLIPHDGSELKIPGRDDPEKGDILWAIKSSIRYVEPKSSQGNEIPLVDTFDKLFAE